MLKAIVTLLVSCALAFGADAQSQPRPSRKLWWASVAVLAAASVLDAHSSWGSPELNPLLRGPNGRFGARSVGIKSAMGGGLVAVQWLTLRRYPKVEKPAAAVNCAIAASTLAAVVHNSKPVSPVSRSLSDPAGSAARISSHSLGRGFVPHFGQGAPTARP